MANKKFTQVNNDYTINFSRSSNIRPVADNGSIKKMTLTFAKLKDLEIY
jgi:hypothetical protein